MVGPSGGMLELLEAMITRRIRVGLPKIHHLVPGETGQTRLRLEVHQ